MCNGELTFKKAVKVVKGYDIPVTELQEYCEAIVFVENIIEEAIESMGWMITNLKWQYRQDKGLTESIYEGDDLVEYSPEIRKAMEVLEKLKQG
jgi:hypothetical protein